MKHEDIVNAITVLRDITKKAGLAYEVADKMLLDLEKHKLYDEQDIEKAFCLGWLQSREENLVERLSKDLITQWQKIRGNFFS